MERKDSVKQVIDDEDSFAYVNDTQIIGGVDET